MDKYKHWEVNIDELKITWLGLNKLGATVNVICDEVLDELNCILQAMTKDLKTIGLIIYSAKKGKGFILGADINRIAELKSPAEVVDFLKKGQTVFSRLENMQVPTLAMIDGFCLGGGLELALSCNYRVGSDSSKTMLGLPEIKLGIHPGWGGTVRLPRLIGGFNALSKIMLTGSNITAIRAKQLGILDEVVPLRQLKRAAVYYINHKPRKHQPTYIQSLTNYAIVRPLLASFMRRNIAKRIQKSQYPAPYALIDLWENEGCFRTRSYLKEIDSIEQLMTKSLTAANLIRIFLLRQKLKAIAGNSAVKVSHVHVIGAGVMGADIAVWCAMSGLSVTIQDRTLLEIAPAIARAYNLFNKSDKKPYLVKEAMDRLQIDEAGHGIARADVIIEAVTENLDVKQSVITNIEMQAKQAAIIATNTSSILLEELSSVMKNPERLVGIHFFNPVMKMQLVEVVHSMQTNAQVLQAANAFVVQIGKLPLAVKSSPGFLINRILMAYLMEAMSLLEDGHSPESIDAAAIAFGMLMGPIELLDTVGLDVCLAVAENLTKHFGGNIPQVLRNLIKEGHIGRKVGRGFYQYKNTKPIKHIVKMLIPSRELMDRLVLRIVSVAASCLREGVVENGDLLDIGMILATGFAPSSGGPIHYAKHLGLNKLTVDFAKLEAQYGKDSGFARFKEDAAGLFLS